MHILPIDPVVPIRIFDAHESTIVAQLIQLHVDYGFRRFAILAPDKTIRFTGLPGIERYRAVGERIARIRKALKAYDVEIIWECSATIKHGPGGSFQQMVGLDGRQSDISFCPLDKDFQAYFTRAVAAVLEIGQPAMMIMEDDFTLRHAGGVGCACPLHLAAFEARQGRPFTREQLCEIFASRTRETLDIRRAWVELARDSLVDFAAIVRRQVDAIAPQTRIMLCQPGAADLEGNFTEAVTRALAGNTRPAVRLAGVDYGSDDATSLPQTLFHALHCAQRLPADFELYHESDTFPHTRFFTSSAKIKSVITFALAYGMTDARFHPTQNTDNPLEEAGYAQMFRRERSRFDALKKAVAPCSVQGCEVLYRADEQLTPPARRYAWANVLARLGIPHTSSGGRVKMLSGNTADVLSDDELRMLLSGPLFLDGRAAIALVERGFGQYIGAEAKPGSDPAFLYEAIRDDAGFTGVVGRIMYNFLFFGTVGPEGGGFAHLTPHEGTQVLTDFCSNDEAPVLPAIMRFENSLGGRVAITAYDLNHNTSSAVINYKKKQILKQTIEWLGREALPVFVRDLPNVFAVFNGAADGRSAVVALINLCSDTFDAIPLEFAQAWAGASMSLLSEAGNWEAAPVDWQGNVATVRAPLPRLSPMILKLSM